MKKTVPITVKRECECEEITTRFTRLQDLNFKFGFLLDVEILSNVKTSMLSVKIAMILEIFTILTLMAENFTLKFVTVRRVSNSMLDTRHDVLPRSPLQLLSFIVTYGEYVFPNLRISLQILLTIAVSIASCERSFSKLKIILSYLRASMGQDRLSNLALLSVERETLNTINFDNVIDQFASVKARKINLL